MSESRGWSRVLLVVGVLAVLGWAVPALLMAGRGFAIEDEGTYLLSYRFWDTAAYGITGAQYVYGPAYDALGGSVPALRVLRLVLTLAANLWFAWAFTGWLRSRGTSPTGLGRAALVALLTASAGLSYLWAPLTPGYYDLAATCCLALVALSLGLLARDGRLAVVTGVAAGLASLVLVLVKWPAALAVVAVLVVTARLTSRRLPYLLGWVSGVGVGLLLLQLALVPLGTALGGLRAGVSGAAGHGLGYLAGRYATEGFTAVVGGLVFALPALASYAGAVRWRSGSPAARSALVAAGAAVTGVALPFVLGWRGGDDLGAMVATVTVACLLAAAITAALPRDRAATWLDGRWVGTLLLIVPLLQAAGTNVPLYYVCAECLALWVAWVLLVASRTSELRARAVLADLAALVVAVSMLAGSSTLMSPFKTTGYADDTTQVPGLGLALTPTTAGQYADLRATLAPYVESGVAPVLTLDRAAGLAYVVGGRPLGSTWTDPLTPERTAHLVALDCSSGDPAPVLIADRDPDPALVDALEGCGWDFPGDFRRLEVAGGPPGFTVWVPRG